MKPHALALAFTAAFAASLLVAAAAQAAVVYTYSGNAFALFTNHSSATYTAAQRITGTLTLADGAWSNVFRQDITPLAFDFTDGRARLTAANASATMTLSTNAAGEITSWRFMLYDYFEGRPGWDHLRTSGGDYGSNDTAERYDPSLCLSSCVSRGYNFSAGSWSVTGLTPVQAEPPPTPGALPEPHSLALTLAALLALPVGGLLRRRRRG
jgi:hypothetical protein